MIVHAKQAGKQSANGFKPGRRVGNKKDQNDNGSNTHENIPVIPVTPRKKVRDGDGAAGHGIAPQSFGNNQPVEISAGCQPDRGPAGVCDSRQIGDTRKPHEQPAAHVRCLRAHRCHQRPQLPVAQIKAFCRAVTVFAEIVADIDHQNQICRNGKKNSYLSCIHNCPPLKMTSCFPACDPGHPNPMEAKQPSPAKHRMGTL